MRDLVVMVARAASLAAALLMSTGCGEEATVRVVTARQQVPYRLWAMRTCTPWVRIELELPGASPAQVEHTLVQPIETMITPIAGVLGVASRASYGRATVWAATGTGPMPSASAMIGAALSDRSRLPAEAVLASVAYDSPWLHTNVAAIASASDPAVAERSAGELLDRLRRLPGVHEVAWVGAPPLVLTVRVDPARLVALGLEVAHVEGRLRTAHWDPSQRHPGGGLDPSTLPQLRIFERPDGTTIRLADVAEIVQERGDGPPAPRLSGRAVTVLVTDVHGGEGVAHALSSEAAAPGVATTIVGTASSSACLHPLRGASIEGGLQALALGLPDGGLSASALAERFGEGLWLFDRPEVFAGSGGTRRAAQWLAPADAALPDLASVPGVTIVRRAAPGLHAIAIAMIGHDRATLRSAAGSLREALRERGEEVLDDAPTQTILTLRLTEAARAAGLRIGDLAAARASSRDVPGVTTWSGHPIRLLVGDAPAMDVEAVDDVAVPLPSGGVAPLSTLAELRSEPATDLARIDGEPVHVVHLITRDVAVTRAAIDTELQRSNLPPGTRATILE